MLISEDSHQTQHRAEVIFVCLLKESCDKSCKHTKYEAQNVQFGSNPSKRTWKTGLCPISLAMALTIWIKNQILLKLCLFSYNCYPQKTCFSQTPMREDRTKSMIVN